MTWKVNAKRDQHICGANFLHKFGPHPEAGLTGSRYFRGSGQQLHTLQGQVDALVVGQQQAIHKHEESWEEEPETPDCEPEAFTCLRPPSARIQVRGMDRASSHNRGSLRQEPWWGPKFQIGQLKFRKGDRRMRNNAAL